jgi:O-antigen/teichoic acid export membrane protein
VAIAYACALALKLLLGWMLMPRYGPAGAAAAVLIAELALAPMLVRALAQAGIPVGGRALLSLLTTPRAARVEAASPGAL